MTQVTNRQTLLEKVGRKWKSDPIFSTGLVLALMVILQTVALGFDYESFGAWFTNWGKNWINILRNNAGQARGSVRYPGAGHDLCHHLRRH